MKSILILLSIVFTFSASAQLVPYKQISKNPWKMAGTFTYNDTGHVAIGTSTDDGHWLRVPGPVSFGGSYGSLYYVDSSGTLIELSKPASAGTKKVITWRNNLPQWIEDSIGGGSGGGNQWTQSVGDTNNIYRQNGKVNLGGSTFPGKFTMVGSNATTTRPDSNSFYMISPVIATSGNPKSSPSIVLGTHSFNTTTGLSVLTLFKLTAVGVSGTTSGLFGSNILIEQSNDSGATYTTLMTLSQANGTGVITMGSNTFGSVTNIASSLGTPSLTTQSFTANGTSSFSTGTNTSNANSITRTANVTGGTNTLNNLIINPVFNLNAGTTTYRGIYYNPTMATRQGLYGIAYENISGDVKLGNGEGGVTIGVAPNIDSSAILDIRTTTQGILLPRMTKAQRNKIHGNIVGTIGAGSGYSNTVSVFKTLTGGTGSGATANITVAGNVVTGVQIVSPGSGYIVGDVLTTSLTGGSGFTYTLTTVQPAAIGLEIYQTDNTQGKRVWNGTNWMRYTETAD